ncbi:DUF3368 domain-containing protein [Oscillatoria sp. CS-180]|uniref:DUF3368 domain-containing protein n=1 Tax=Oscillatoria sp. CS-180 TaxID=3021720 RepID=UPI00233009B5|nr:DUF3368 domain-containing protein [Oscillatoria sp. CS-180]MDB9524423.1 DUF3368 domain-containing protein [Oscillatoria sp. CS-180]
MPDSKVIVVNTSPLISLVAGRRIARLCGLSLTGSIGVLLKDKQQNPSFSLKSAIDNMLNHRIRLSKTVIDFALKQSGEKS